MYKNQKNNKGYTLLFAVLVSAIVLSVGISILNISKKEFLLASAARDSMAAFYAADSALECAVYNIDKIATTSKGGTSSGSVFHCMGRRFDLAPRFLNNDEYDKATYEFDIKGPASDSKSCSRVVLEKFYEYDPELDTNVPATSIDVRGYNTGWNEPFRTCDIASPRRVERGINYKL